MKFIDNFEDVDYIDDFDVRTFEWWGKAKDWINKASKFNMLDEVQTYLEKYFEKRVNRFRNGIPEYDSINYIVCVDDKLHEIIKTKENSRLG